MTSVVTHPPFALILSVEGIALAHLQGDRWDLVGEVDPAAPDLGTKLSHLRDKAAAVAPGRLATRLIIPNDQIRFMSLELGMLGEEQRHARVRQALDGATPYPLDELVYDIAIDGQVTHVAAVALETLREAEGFASQSGFNPQTFGALPEAQDFPGDVFFGAVADIVQAAPGTPSKSPAPPPSAARRTRPGRLLLPLLGGVAIVAGLLALSGVLSEDPVPTAPGTTEVPSDDTQNSALPAPSRPLAAEPPKLAAATVQDSLAPEISVQLTSVQLTSGPALATRSAAMARPTMVQPAHLRGGHAWITPVAATTPPPPPRDQAQAADQPITRALQAGPPALPRISVLSVALAALADMPDLRPEAAPSALPFGTHSAAATTAMATGEDVLYQPLSAQLPDIRSATISLPETAPLGRGATVQTVALDAAIAAPPQLPDAPPQAAPPRISPAAPSQIALSAPEAGPDTLPDLPTPVGPSLDAAIRAAYEPLPDPPEDTTPVVVVTLSEGSNAVRPVLRPKLPDPELSEEARIALARAAVTPPKLRPAIMVTALASASNGPRLRPAGLTVAAPRAAVRDPAPASQQASAETPRSETVSPRIQSGATVAKAATQRNQLSLNRVALLGVSGAPASRSAIVRMPSGRVRKVGVGDSLDGGRVVAIGQTEVRYLKSGKNLTLKMPRG